MGHLELLKGESAALQFVGSAHWSMLPGFWGELSDYEQVMEKVQAAKSVSSTGTASLQGSPTEACGLFGCHK